MKKDTSLGCRRPSVGTGWAISPLHDELRKQISHLVVLPLNDYVLHILDRPTLAVNTDY